jgi:cytochrome oxidase Cu insertion factor (SCO1/SenC/PrrC family)
MSKTGLFGLAFLFLAGGVLLLVTQISRDTRTPSVRSKLLGTEPDVTFRKEPSWLTEYTLTERSGRKFHSSKLEGKVHVVNFFFTACPTACPLQTKKVQEIDREFGPQGVSFLSISCDPDRDTPVVLSQYADRYNADPERWLFLTGDFDYTRRVAVEVYGAPLPKRMAHREELFTVDKWGKVRGAFPWNDSAQIGSMRKLLKELLAETEPLAESQPTVEEPTESDDGSEDVETARDA